MNRPILFRMICMVSVFIVADTWPEFNTEGQNGVGRTISAKPFGKFKLNIGFGAHFAQSGDYIQGPTEGLYSNLHRIIDTLTPFDNDIIQDPAKLFSSDVFLGMGLADFWDVSVALPFYYEWAGFRDLRDGGLGDLEINSKFLLPPIAVNKFFYESFLISVSIPTGMRSNGLFPRSPSYIENADAWNPAEHFYSTGYIRVKPMLALTFNIGALKPTAPLQIHLNVGGLFTEKNQRNTMISSYAMEYTPVDFFTIFFEIYGESRWKNISSGYNMRKDPLWATPGMRITTPSGLYLSLAGDFSLSSTQTTDRMNWKRKGYEYSTGILPKYGVQLTFGWNGFMATLDDDKDGIPNTIDKCPSEAEDIDGFEDADGCPDLDNDKDGICDPWVATSDKSSKYASMCKGTDKCPNVPEDIDGFQDDDGCPDPDNDGDGIPDGKDQCPGVAEDFDGFQDNDGCPDKDNDKDNIPDSVDKCPGNPEDIDGFQDSDGCPDVDNDKDGIFDLKDKCPDETETFNGHQDEDGCPDTAPKPVPLKKEPDFPHQQILHGLEFINKKAEIAFGSYGILDRIVKSLREYPELEIEIRGYTDSMGKNSTNLQLSQMRAEAVRQYLINQGIDPRRLKAFGFGSSNPIGDNRTASGRAMNRRIEVFRTK